MLGRLAVTLSFAIGISSVTAGCKQQTAVAAQNSLRFEVSAAPGLLARPENGRIFVVMGRPGSFEPRIAIGQPGEAAPPVVAHDVDGFQSGKTVTLDEKSTGFPIENLNKLPPGDYSVQAVFHFNQDLDFPNAPGNLVSETQQIHLDPARPQAIPLHLSRPLPPDELPKQTEYCRFIKLKSVLLSRFHGRPIYLRAGIILPRDYGKERDAEYPLWVQIGGYGSRYDSVLAQMRDGSSFRNTWLADETPRMVLLQLDGAGPNGDPYQVNSANNGPYGDAVTQELIPFVERQFHCMAKPYARFLSGGSTGGWVSLALQVFYPGYFNGCWSVSPDPVDFRSMQLVDIYHDANAFIDAQGKERPSARKPTGEVLYSMRNDVYRENMMGRGDSYTMSGDQWGAWNAVYGPKGKAGRPAAIWDEKTGRIDHRIADQWKPYDLRLYLQERWPSIGPRLRRKIHVSVGEGDDYYLNNAVHMLDDFLSKASPAFEGEIKYAEGKGHTWSAWSTAEMMRQMQQMLEMGMEP